MKLDINKQWITTVIKGSRLVCDRLIFADDVNI